MTGLYASWALLIVKSATIRRAGNK